MKQQMVLTIAIALTAFVMLAVGGVIIAEQTAQAKSSTPAQAQAAQSQNGQQDAQVSQDVLKQISDREAQYQALINRANTQLQQAMDDEKTLQAEVDSLKTANAQEAAQLKSQPATLTPQQASQVASEYMKQKDLYAVEAVHYYNTTAYKVTFSSGAIVFISAHGEIMSAQSAPVVSSMAAAPQGSTNAAPSYNDDGGNDH